MVPENAKPFWLSLTFLIFGFFFFGARLQVAFRRSEFLKWRFVQECIEEEHLSALLITTAFPFAIGVPPPRPPAQGWWFKSCLSACLQVENLREDVVMRKLCPCVEDVFRFS